MAVITDEQKAAETENIGEKHIDLEEAQKKIYSQPEEKSEETSEEGEAEETENKEEKSEEGKTDEKEAEQTGEVIPVTAEDIAFPDGVEVDQTIQEEFLKFANDSKFTKEQTQGLVDLQTKLYQAQAEQHQAKLAGWVSEVKSDKELVGDTGDKLDENLALAKKGMEALKVDGLSEYLDSSGEGSNPIFVRMFTRIGKTISEDSFKTGGVGKEVKEKSAADTLYPKKS